jgi:cytochrome oxidase assembly protein ShyY1
LPLRYQPPRWPWTLLTLVAISAFMGLGFWQYQRGTARAAQWREFTAAGAAQDVDAVQMVALPRWTRVRVRGQWDAGRQFLLDNISQDGAPGYEVLTVLHLAEGGDLLVNRGWLPFSGYRDRLPDVSIAGDAVAEGTASVQVVAGRLSVLPVAGLALGRQPPAMSGSWPRLTTFPAHAELEAAWGAMLLPPVLLLDPDSGSGYVRQWRPPGLAPERHFGYAAQWWMFAAAVVVIYLVMNVKRIR